MNVISVDELYEVEKAFSDMSAEKGMIEAFSYYCDEEGVILIQDSHPVVGKTAVISELSSSPDTELTLTWEATDARIAASGDLGYTYGTYILNFTEEDQEDSEGSYITIWKKNEDGDWKFVLDTGQDGLGE